MVIYLRNIINLNEYKKDDIIYPSNIVKKYNLSMSDAYHLLEQLKNKKRIVPIYMLYCPSCEKFCTPIIYEVISKMTEYETCVHCNRTLEPIKHCIVLYRVL